MTETTCPTCGGRCLEIEKPCILPDGCNAHTGWVALPQPGLTKLREAFKKWEDTIPNTSNILYPTFANIVLPDIWQAVKELLEENK